MDPREIEAVVRGVVSKTQALDLGVKTPPIVKGEVAEIAPEQIDRIGRLISERLFRVQAGDDRQFVRSDEKIIAIGLNYHYSSTLVGEGLTIEFAVQFNFNDDEYVICLPSMIEITHDVNQALSDLEKLLLDFPESDISSELPIISMPKNQDDETFSNLATVKERQDFLDKLSSNDLYQLALINFHCAVMVLNYSDDKFKQFSFEQQTDIKRNLHNNLLPKLTDEFVKNLGDLSVANKNGLTEFADSLLTVFIHNPHEIQRLNADALFLLTTKNPVFFTLLENTALFRTQEETRDLIEGMTQCYDALFASYRKATIVSPEIRNSIGNFAEYVAKAVNKNEVPLTTALNSAVVQNSTITVGSANIKLSARLVANALDRKSGVKELVTLLENKPSLLSSALKKTDEIMLSTYLLDDQNLVKKLSSNAVKTLLQYDQGVATRIPTFLDGLAMRLGYGANPLKKLSIEELFDVAVAAKNNNNQEQVNGIITRCITEPGRWERFKLSLSGQTNYYNEFLESPAALSQFYKLASSAQIQQFIGRDEAKRNALLAAVYHAQTKTQVNNIAYLSELKRDKIDLLQELQNQDLQLAVDDPLKRMIDTRIALESTQDADLLAQLEAQNTITELETDDPAKHQKMRDVPQWARLLNLINDKPLMTHRLIDVIKNKSEIAEMFTQNITGLLGAIDVSPEADNENIYSLLTEIIQVIIENHAEFSSVLMNYLIARVSADEAQRDKFQGQIGRILNDQKGSMITSALLNASYINARGADDKVRLRSAEQFFQTLRFLLSVEGMRDGFTGKYIADNQANIGNLITAVISQWLRMAVDAAKANTSALEKMINQLPVIKFFQKLYGEVEAKKLMDTIIEQNIGSCISLYDYDTKRQINWLYAQPSFWIGLFANSARFDSYTATQSFKADDVMSKAFMSAFPKLIARLLNDDQETKTVQMIQSLININKDNVGLIKKIITDIQGLDNFERAERLLAKTFANLNVLSILVRVNDSNFSFKLSHNPDFWRLLFESSNLRKEFLGGKLPNLRVTVDNSDNVEAAIKTIKDGQSLSLLKTNADQLGFKLIGGQWRFAGLSSSPAVPTVAQTLHPDEDDREGEGERPKR